MVFKRQGLDAPHMGWDVQARTWGMPTATKESSTPRRTRWHVGQVMTHHAYDGSGILLLAAGQRVEDEFMARRLSAYDVQLVRPGAAREKPGSDSPAEQPVPPGTVAYHEELKRACQVRSFAVRRVTTVLRRIQAGGPVARGDVEPVVRSILDSLLRNSTALLSLVQMRSFDRYTFTHSVNVCVLTLVLAREYDPEADLAEIGAGGLLHDLGKMRLPAHLLNKAAALSHAEFAAVQQHPHYGVELLSRSQDVNSETVARAVLEHHERTDGSGYPSHLTGDQVSLAGKLVAIADTYDAMTTVRPYRGRILPKDALAWLYAQRGLKHDADAVVAFIKAMGVYPVGSGVRLGTGEIAVVIGVNRERPTQPLVLIVRDRRGGKASPPRVVDLADDGGQIASHVDLLGLGIRPVAYLAPTGR